MWQDIAYAIRGLGKNPVFAITAVLTLALGIGGNTAMFSVIRAVLLKPLEYQNPEQLVSLNGGASVVRFDELKKTQRSLSGVGAYTGEESLTLTGGAEPEVLRGARVSGNFLSILGKHPLVGRSFSAAEDTPGGAPAVMISAELWDRLFHHDTGITQKTVTLSETNYQVIGVLPPHFVFPYAGVDVWMTRPAEWSVMPAKSREDSPFLTLFGRLNNGITMQQANAELTLIRHRYALDHPAMLDSKEKSPVEAKPLKDELVTDVRTMLWMLFGAVGFVLLITCANVASLMLARARSRSREFAVRAAIGASRFRLMSHLLAESVILSLTGGAVGVALAALLLRLIPLMTMFDLPRSGEIQMDWVVMIFAVVISIATGVAFGLIPSVSVSKPDLISVLRGTGAAASDGKFNTRNILVVGQIAFSIVLLIGAALMIETVARLRNVNVGFNPEHLLTARISLPPLHYDSGLKQSAFFVDLAQKLDSLPGVRSATAAMTLPMMEAAGTPVQDAAKPHLRLNQRPIATVCVVTPNYFRTLEIPIRRGRDFNEADKKESERVAIVDEALARKLWPQYPAGLNPVGQQLLVGGSNPHPARIVGIVPAVHQNLENNVWPETVYVAFEQSPQPFAMIAVHADADPRRLTATIRKAVQSIDRELPVAEVRTMDDLVDAELGKRKLVVDLLGSFAAIALLLALIGIYGTISYSVAQRIQELGIRCALGAQRADILQLVIGQGVVLALIGIAAGMAGSYWLTKALSGLLFGVSGTDPATFVGIGVLFVTAAGFASYLPARRAARIDPMTALRV